MNENQQEIIFITDDKPITHPFHNKQLVFTGALTTMTRSEAAKRARLCGATMQGAVTRETDFVILGNKRRSTSSKQLKAEQLIQYGHDIQLIEECDFLWLLSIDQPGK